MEFVKDKKKKDIPQLSQFFNPSEEQIKVDEEFEENLKEIFGMSEEKEGEEEQ